jgi:hypothetical protein
MSLIAKHRETVDSISKITGIILAIFYVTQYTFDISRENARLANEAARFYIKRFYSEDLVGARTNILSFLRDRSEVVSLAVQGAIPYENYGYYLIQQLDSEPKVWESFNKIGYFFDELHVCYISKNCDQASIEDVLCDSVIGFERSSFNFLRKNDTKVIGHDLFDGVRRLSEMCMEKKR